MSALSTHSLGALRGLQDNAPVATVQSNRWRGGGAARSLPW